MKFMKKIAIAVFAFVAAFGFVALSCGKAKISGTADTVFAETKSDSQVAAVPISSESLKVLEALQSSFRSISSGVLPSVVEVDVVSKKQMPQNPFFDMNPFEGSPFDWFFGNPNRGKDDSKENKEKSKPREYEQKGLGSGVIVRLTGNVAYVLTNNHVAGDASEITVKLNDGRKYECKLVGHDERQDIALLSFEIKKGESIVVAKLADSDKVETGDICLAMGAPLGYSQSVTQGIVSATGRSGNDIGNINNFIQTDAAINQGNSGGPLVNIYGEVIGINTWIASQGGGSVGLGFAMPINSIKKAIDDFISKGKVSYGWLGVSLLEVNDKYREQLGVKNRNGAFVADMFLDSPAFKGGFQAGDYIVELNGKEVKGVNELVREVGLLQAGAEAAFKVVRNKKDVSLNIKIEERKSEVSSDNSKLWPGFVAGILDDESKKELKIEDKSLKGVVVMNVTEKTPAAALRLQNGDIITAVNGVKVSNVSEFYGALNAKKGSEVYFDLHADGHTITTSRFKF